MEMVYNWEVAYKYALGHEKKLFSFVSFGQSTCYFVLFYSHLLIIIKSSNLTITIIIITSLCTLYALYVGLGLQHELQISCLFLCLFPNTSQFFISSWDLISPFRSYNIYNHLDFSHLLLMFFICPSWLMVIIFVCLYSYPLKIT